jgi:signal peptidase I
MRSPLTRSHKPEKDGDASAESPWSLLRFILTLALLAWAIRSLVIAPFSIPSGSMLPTLYVGDYLAVAKWPYGYSRFSLMFGFPPFEGRIFGSLPERGDVVVFRHPVENTDLIKRVIALPGDTVQLVGGRVILNGRVLPRQEISRFKMPISPNSPCRAVPPATPLAIRASAGPVCVYAAYREALPGGRAYQTLDQVQGGHGDDRPAVRVPSGHVFLLGDNRDDSLDSRFDHGTGGVGMVPTERLIGRALVTFWSTDGSASYWKPWTWFTALRGRRIGNGYDE